jgi:23S rRNA-/tRNA-specific pseudouridylate synthase
VRAGPDAPIPVLFQSAHYLVVEKPPGLATTSPDGGDCLAARVQALDPRAERCHPSSRLDAEVSGVVVFARTSRGIETLLEARRRGRYARRYLALAHAPPEGTALSEGEEATWRWPIAIDPRDPRKRRALAPGERGARAQDAETRARVLSRAPLAASLLLRPITGRTHQLRVHAARAEMPLLGDVAYGGARRLVSADGAVIACRRVALHCAVVVVPAPDGTPHAFRAPFPEDLASVARALGLPEIDLDAVERDARPA